MVKRNIEPPVETMVAVGVIFFTGVSNERAGGLFKGRPYWHPLGGVNKDLLAPPGGVNKNLLAPPRGCR